VEKTCPKCRTTKQETEFYKRANRKSGFSPRCKDCSNEASRLSRVKRRLVDPEFVKRERQNSQSWKDNNPEGFKASQSKWRNSVKDDPIFKAKHNDTTAKRKAAKLKATPVCLSDYHRASISSIYKACSNITHQTGIKHEVDHIIPLKNKEVCGLHVPWNLAIIPATMNRKKGNAFSNSFYADDTSKQLQQQPTEPTDRRGSEGSSEYTGGEDQQSDSRNDK